MTLTMISAPVPRDRGDFHIAILCALPLEAEYVVGTLDHVWKDKRYSAPSNDNNSYTLGAIGQHNVVVIHMPGIGSQRSASAVNTLMASYLSITLVLVVGVCGGMPTGPENNEILLGDIIISKALIQYDFVDQHPDGFRRKTDVLNALSAPNEKILGLLSKLEVRQCKEDLQNKTVTFLQKIQRESSKAEYPGSEHDILYASSYTHRHHKPGQCRTCEITNEVCETAIGTECEDLECESDMRIPRQRLLLSPLTTQPVIHIGTMGCASTVMKSGHHRDTLARKEGIIAVEMEGAGVWRYGPSIVIKGVCDYADSHKRKHWQRYAAATAAACMKAFLLEWWLPKNRDDNSGRPWDVELDEQARSEKLRWRESVVDLLKLLKLPSRVADRQKLATRLDLSINIDGSPGPNNDLYVAIIKELAAHEGQITARLRGHC